MVDQGLPDVNSLTEHFAGLPDPRSPINRHHLLVDVIVMCVCGVLSGADGPAAIAFWAKCHIDWLHEHLTLLHGIPSRDTFRRVLQRLKPEAFQHCFTAWLESLIGHGRPHEFIGHATA